MTYYKYIIYIIGFGVIGPKFAPQPRLLATEFFDGRTGQPIRGGGGGGGIAFIIFLFQEQ
jgi:hypothetical protein